MPTYLCHGFRWYRRNIRIFVILNDLDECAPDWIVGRATAAVLLSQLAEAFPFVPRLENEDGTIKKLSTPAAPAVAKKPAFYDDDLSMPPSRIPPHQDEILMHEWSPIKLLEEYDENETDHAARPYAYLADHVVRVDLGADVLAEIAAYDASLKRPNAEWFEKLRENMQPEEESRWYMVVCDDMEREPPEEAGGSDTEGDLTETDNASTTSPQRAVSKSDEVPAATERPFSHENKMLPLVLTQEPTEQQPAQPAFLNQDPFESEQRPPPRLKKKMSIRRLFSKKEG